jgi:protein-tyrosine-phosphatase
MAAALARHYLGRRVVVDSVGIEAGLIDPFAVAVMAEEGIDISAHRAKTFADLEDEAAFDLIISLAPEAHHHALDLTRAWAVEVEYWPTQDPTLQRDLGRPRLEVLAAYRAVRDELKARILSRLLPGLPGNL